MTFPRSAHLVWLAIIGAVAPTISSVAAFVMAWRTTTKVEAVDVKVEHVQKQTDGLKDALVASTRKQSLQEGEIAGKKEGRAAGVAEGKEKGHAAGVAEEKSKHFFNS